MRSIAEGPEGLFDVPSDTAKGFPILLPIPLMPFAAEPLLFELVPVFPLPFVPTLPLSIVLTEPFDPVLPFDPADPVDPIDPVVSIDPFEPGTLRSPEEP